MYVVTYLLYGYRGRLLEFYMLHVVCTRAELLAVRSSVSVSFSTPCAWYLCPDCFNHFTASLWCVCTRVGLVPCCKKAVCSWWYSLWFPHWFWCRLGLAPNQIIYSNLRLCFDHPGVVDVAQEVQAGGVASPFKFPPLPQLHVSPFVIPKSHQPGKWRLILDLSSPHGQRVNDGIPKNLFSLGRVRFWRSHGKIRCASRLWEFGYSPWRSLSPGHEVERRLLRSFFRLTCVPRRSCLTP